MEERKEIEFAELDRKQAAYKMAVDEWIAAILDEKALASVNHSVAEIDGWEAAHFKRKKFARGMAARADYEGALRHKFLDFR